MILLASMILFFEKIKKSPKKIIQHEKNQSHFLAQFLVLAYFRFFLFHKMMAHLLMLKILLFQIMDW